MSVPPKELLALHQGGDREAGIALCRALHPAVRALALAGTLDPEQADEATRESLARILDRLGEVDAPNRLLPLAKEVVTEEVRKIFQRQGGQSTELVGIPADRAARAKAGALDLEAVFGDIPPDRAALMLLEACGWLPDAYQAAFLLRYLVGLRYQEIAELTGATPREVGNSLAAARKLYERELLFHLKKLAAS